MRSISQSATISMVWILGSLAAAFGPEDALRYKDPRLDLVKAQFDAAQQALQIAQLGIGSRVIPTFSYRQSPDPFFVGNTVSSDNYGLRLELGWTLNPSSLGQLSRSLEDVREAYLRLQRESTRSALQAHTRVWQQQLFVREAEARVGLAQARLNATRERREENRATDLDVQRAELGLEGARLNLELARNALSAAQRDAAAYGLRGNAESRTVRFATPEVDPKATPRYLSELANLTQAQIESRSASFSWLPTFRVGLGISANRDALGIGGALSFNEGVLGVGTSLELRKPSTDPGATVEPSWGITLEAEVNLYALIFDTSYGASARVQSQSLFLQTLQAQIAADLQARRERLALLERRLSLGERATALEQEYLAQSKALYDRGELTSEEYFERIADARNEIDYSFAWSEYVDAVSEYLELTGLPWALRQ
jgi:hypothetical protein